MGRKAVVICSATSRKMMTHVWKPACDRAFEWENQASKNRSPKMVAMNQKTRCSVPIQASDSVDCEKIHATGAKPMSRIVISINKPASSPQTSTSRAWEPLKQVKI